MTKDADTYQCMYYIYYNNIATGRYCYELCTQAAAQVLLTTVHQAKGLEWPRVELSEDLGPLLKVRERNESSTY